MNKTLMKIMKIKKKTITFEKEKNCTEKNENRKKENLDFLKTVKEN